MRATLAGGAPANDTMPELPSLDPDLQLLNVDAESIAPGALHSLVVDHLLLNAGQAYWVDSQGQIAPHHLARIAPSPRVLDRVQVARGFTPYQHYTLIDHLSRHVDAAFADEDAASTDSESRYGLGGASESKISLVVVPALDRLYREESALNRGHRDDREMLLHSLATLKRLAQQHDLPVLVSLSHGSGFAASVERAASKVIRCEQTRFGPRFIVDGDTEDDRFETLVYPVGNGMVQTTLAFWREVLAARASLYERAQPTAGSLPSNTGGNDRARGTGLAPNERGDAPTEVTADGTETY